MQEIELKNTNSENNNKTKDIIEFVDKQTKIISFKSVLLGLNESLKALNMFLDEKVAMGKTDTMSRQELNVFMQTYIGEYEKGIAIKNEEKNNLNKEK